MEQVIAIDGACGIVSFQAKVFLAFVGGVYGDCYPIVLIVSVEIAVVIQLCLMGFWRFYRCDGQKEFVSL